MMMPEDPNVRLCREALESYDREDEYRRQRMTDFTKYVNHELDKLTPTRRTDAATTA
jgi:hypothetical protein